MIGTAQTRLCPSYGSRSAVKCRSRILAVAVLVLVSYWNFVA